MLQDFHGENILIGVSLIGVYVYALLVRAVDCSEGELNPAASQAAIRQTCGASQDGVYGSYLLSNVDGALVRGLGYRDVGVRDKPVLRLSGLCSCAIRSVPCGLWWNADNAGLRL